MAEIKIQDILFKIQQFKAQNPQKVKGLNDEQVASIMFQEGKFPEEAKKLLAQILSGQYVKEEGTILGQKSRTFTGKDKDGNLKTDVYIDFNGDNVADLKIFKKGKNVFVFASTQVNGQITDWTRTNDYDEYKSAVIDTVEINNAPVSTGKEEPAKTPEDKEKEKLAKKEDNIKVHLREIFRDEELKDLFLRSSSEMQNALLNEDAKRLCMRMSSFCRNYYDYKDAAKAFLIDAYENDEIRIAYLTSHDRGDLAKFFLKPLAEQEKLLNSDNIMQSFAPQKVVNPQAEAAKLERLKRKFLSNADEKTKEYFKQLDNEGQRLFLYAYEHDFKHQTFENASSFKEFVLNDFLERHKVSRKELEEREAANNVKLLRRDFFSSADKETLTFFNQLSDEGQKVFLEAYENDSSEEINKSEFLKKYKASDETIQHRKQERKFISMLAAIDSFKTAQECQIFIDRINEDSKDEIDEYKYVLDAAQTKMSSFPPEEIAKAQDPAWREEMRISREMNHLTARTLLDRERKASVDLDRQHSQMGWADWTGQAILDLFGESDIEEAYANLAAFSEKVSRLYAVQYKMTREEFGKEVEKIMGQGKYDHKLVEKIQRNHPEYLQLTSAKNTVDALNALAKKEYSKESIREIEQAFGGIDKIKEYMPNYEEYSDETKFVKLKSLVRASASNAKAQLDQTLNGRNYDAVIKAHEADYEKFLKMIGVKDIDQKMQEYRENVASAAGWVKCAVTVASTVALTVATGGAGGVLAAGLIATGTSAAVEISNRATNDVADLSSWSDWGEIGQSAAIDGLSTALGMKVGGKIFASTMGKYAKFGASVASDTAIGAVAEFAQTGQVTIEGTLMNAAMAGAGNGLAVYVEGKGMRKYTPNKDLPVYKPPTDGQIAIVNTNEPSEAIRILKSSNIKNSTGTLSVLNPQNTKKLTNNQVLILNMVVNYDNKANLSMDLIDKLLANGDPRFADACLSRNLDFANLPPEKHATLVELHTAVDKKMPKYPNLTLDDVMAYDPKKAKLFDKAYPITRIFGQDRSNIQKAMSKPQRVDAIIEFFEKNKDYIKNQEQIDFLFSCTDAEFKDTIKKMKQTALHNRLVIDSNSGVPDRSNFPNLRKIKSPETVNGLLNDKSLTDIEKAVLEETYEHLCDLGFKDKIDADPALLLNLSKNKYNIGVDVTKLSKADIETILYAREQYKKGLISEAEQNQVLERINMGTPAALFKYIDTPENLIPETVTIKRSWGENTYTKEQIIEWAKGDRVLRKLLDRQSTPVDLTVHRVDDESIYKNIKIEGKSLESLLAEGKSPEEIVKLINNSTSSAMKFDNFIGTSLGGVTGFTNNNSVRWEIDVPKGSKGAHLDSLVNPKKYMGENEFLLQAGTTLRIKEARYENGQFILKAVVDQDSCKKLTQAEQPTSLTRAAETTPTSAQPAAEAVPLKSSKTNTSTQLDTDSTQAKPPTYTDEQLSEIMQKYKISEFDRAILERLATLAPETLENILKNSKEPKALSTLLWILRDIPDEELKNLKGNMPIPKRIKSKNLPPELQRKYMDILLSDNDIILYKLDLSDSVTCQKILENIKKIPENELVVINNTLSNSLDPVAIKKAMEKIGLSDDDIPINNNQQLTKEARDLLTDIICSKFDFTTTEINEILQSGDSKLHEIRFQKAQKKIMLTEGVINNGQKLSPAQKQRIIDLAYNTDQKYTSDEINKIINAPANEYDALVDLYNKKPENYSLTLGEDLRIDSKSTILEVNGSEKYLIDMNNEDMQAAINKLKDGESFTIIRGNINPQDPALSPILAIVKKENGQIIIQNCSFNGIVINPNNNIPINNVKSNNTTISAKYEDLVQSYNTYKKNNFILSKLFENPELKNISPDLIYDVFYLNCSDKLYAKIVAGEKITKQTLIDLKNEKFLSLVKNSENKDAMKAILKLEGINAEAANKILYLEDSILNKVKAAILAGKTITTESLDYITTETIIEQIQKGHNKFSISDKQIVDTILSSPYAKDFTSMELLNILNNDQYRRIALGKIRDGQPITKDLFQPFSVYSSDGIIINININDKITTLQLLDIANREIHKKSTISAKAQTREFAKIDDATISAYYKNPAKNQAAINKLIPAGEIRKASDGTLYYNSGQELIKIELDEKTFRDLFPVSMQNRLQQGSIGDCWLISTFGALMDSPVGRGQIYKLFKQKGNIISVKLPDMEEPIQFEIVRTGEFLYKGKTVSSNEYRPINLKNIHNQSYDELVIRQGNSKKNPKIDIDENTGEIRELNQITLRASKGLRMLEIVCADYRADKLCKIQKTSFFSLEEIISSFDFSAMRKILCGGDPKDAINLICGYKDHRIIHELNLKDNIGAQMSALKEYLTNNPDAIVIFSTKGNNDNIYWNKEFDLFKQHAYRVVDVNIAKGTITISNPHHNNMTVEIPFAQWIRYVAYCEVIDIR